ncbi:NAD(P)H-hydrate dehydratase [Nocardioides sp.]|uniref:NAD(P)H-hydrate dehydratase n=1 Tax=Nocardioides sp. TaxID=35761 RepID=UPI00356A7303
MEAALTITFGTHKVCHLVDPAAGACGAVHLVDIGLDLPQAAVQALLPEDVARLLPVPAADAHKYSRGVVGVRTGSAEYPGAALLSVAGASSGLCGMVRYVGDPTVAATVREVHPEVVGAGRVQAWVVGSGSGDDAWSALEAALAERVPVVIDADALGHLGVERLDVPAVLTPHAGELAQLLGVRRAEIEARPLLHAREAADRYQAVVLLKGRRTVVAEPSGAVRVNTTGTPWLATAGAGDVLAGLIGSLLAAGLTAYDAAAVGAWLHGSAAHLAAHLTGRQSGQAAPIVASDVANAIPAAVRAALRGA